MLWFWLFRAINKYDTTISWTGKMVTANRLPVKTIYCTPVNLKTRKRSGTSFQMIMEIHFFNQNAKFLMSCLQISDRLNFFYRTWLLSLNKTSVLFFTTKFKFKYVLDFTLSFMFPYELQPRLNSRLLVIRKRRIFCLTIEIDTSVKWG